MFDKILQSNCQGKVKIEENYEDGVCQSRSIDFNSDCNTRIIVSRIKSNPHLTGVQISCRGDNNKMPSRVRIEFQIRFELVTGIELENKEPYIRFSGLVQPLIESIFIDNTLQSKDCHTITMNRDLYLLAHFNTEGKREGWYIRIDSKGTKRSLYANNELVETNSQEYPDTDLISPGLRNSVLYRDLSRG